MEDMPHHLPRTRRLLGGVLLSLISTAALSDSPPERLPMVLEAAKTELARSMEQLKQQEIAPYFLSYEIVESRAAAVTASFGALTHSSDNKRRVLRVSVHIGDFSLDNTRQVRGSLAGNAAPIPMPVEDDALAIRNVLWYQTDKRYKQALEELARARTVSQVAVAQEDKSADFSAAPPQQSIEPVAAFSINRKIWEDKIRKYTAPFQKYGNLYDATATFSANQDTRWFVSSDGSAIQSSQTYFRLQISAFSKADDGMELPRYETYFAYSPEGLPNDATVLKAVDKMIADLMALRKAAVVDPFTGPAILSGRATAVFFHEVFGHRIEGHRQKSESEGQTFKKMVDQAVLPDFLSVAFDPTLRRYAGTDLAGSYDFDDEGVKAQRVNVVSDGVMHSFLMSRTPIDGFPSSNGHGRAQPGFNPVARQSNLLVLNSKPLSRERLRALLIEEIKRQDKPFGLLFDDIAGGFTITGRTIPNAFNVLPLVVYRVYPDGREELVRGVDLIGTPLTVFSKILAAGDQAAVFNGVCGAESGAIPVSASAPAILVSQIEVQKKSKSQERAPILGAPFEDR
jgi:TldD protein